MLHLLVRFITTTKAISLNTMKSFKINKFTKHTIDGWIFKWLFSQILWHRGKCQGRMTLWGILTYVRGSLAPNGSIRPSESTQVFLACFLFVSCLIRWPTFFVHYYDLQWISFPHRHIHLLLFREKSMGSDFKVILMPEGVWTELDMWNLQTIIFCF